MPLAPPVQTMKAKSFLAGATPFAGAGGSEPPPPPTINDKAWLSEKRLQPGAGAAVAVVTELDGKRVHIGGYVVPLDFEATNVKEFLLVPFVGACIHVPPPPPNQIIYVKTAKGFDVEGSFDPVYVTGTLKATSRLYRLARPLQHPTPKGRDAGRGQYRYPLDCFRSRHPGNAGGVIYRLGCQAVWAWRQGSPERRMALSVTMSFRITAVITTLAGLPSRLSLSAKLFMMGLYRIAVRAAM